MQERSADSSMPAYVVVSLLRAGHSRAHLADVDELLEKHMASVQHVGSQMVLQTAICVDLLA